MEIVAGLLSTGCCCIASLALVAAIYWFLIRKKGDAGDASAMLGETVAGASAAAGSVANAAAKAVAPAPAPAAPVAAPAPPPLTPAQQQAHAASALSGTEQVSGMEHVHVVGTGDDTKVLAEDGAAKFIEDEDSRIWIDVSGNDSTIASQWRDDWGPVTPGDSETLAAHECDIGDANGLDPDSLPQLVRSLGYRDVGHWFDVRRTGVKHFGQGNPNGPLDDFVFGEDFMQAMLRGRMSQHQRKMQATAAADPNLLAPVEGVTMEQYGEINAQAATGLEQSQFAQLLASKGLDLATWERASAGWADKMSKDTTGTIAAAYGKAFQTAGTGQFGAAGAASAAAQGAMGGFTGDAAGGQEPIPFEKLVEIQGAMTAWSESGQDVNAMLDSAFGINALDWSSMSTWWMTKMQTEWSLLERYSTESDQWKDKYLAESGVGNDDDITF
jgi:hypothetical protein